MLHPQTGRTWTVLTTSSCTLERDGRLCLSAQNQANVLWAGLYLDAIAYDRATMQRVRRVLDSAKPGSLIDVHQGTRPANGSCNGYPTSGDSPALNYMQHLPSIDRVW